MSGRLCDDAMDSLAETKDWVSRNNPALHQSLGDMSVHDSMVKLCEMYGIEPPNENDIVIERQPRILRELIIKTGKQ